jgi:cholesterol oxidase
VDDAEFDFDWIVVGSGFGGSVAALRLAEKGYRVAVLETGRRLRDDDFAKTGWNLRRMFWLPALGLVGPTRISIFKDIFIASGAGVGGGSLVYANTLYRAKPEFFAHPQWAGLNDWGTLLQPHYAVAERMLGVQTVPWDSDGQQLLRRVASHFGVQDSFTRTPCGVFFGEAGVTVADPYFGGTGPARTGCIRCGGCTDRDGRAFGYRNLIVCDGAILPANPGVNPSLTITALAEQVMSTVPSRAPSGAAQAGSHPALGVRP